MIRVVLFDFNGVIIDDEGLQMRAYEQALASENITLTEADYYGSLGMDDQAFVRAAYGRAGINADDETVARMIRRKAELHRASMAEELPLFAGVVTFVKALSRRFTIGIVSMARGEDVEYALERASLLSHFSIVVSAEDVTAHKPDPQCYNTGFLRADAVERAKNRTSLSPEECLVIEDSPPGVRAGVAAGMRTLGVTNTVKASELREAGAEVVTASLADWTDDTVRHVFERRPAAGQARQVV